MLAVCITFLVCTLLLFVRIPALSDALQPGIPPPAPPVAYEVLST